LMPGSFPPVSDKNARSDGPARLGTNSPSQSQWNLVGVGPHRKILHIDIGANQESSLVKQA
jgi:hypothetical protein